MLKLTTTKTFLVYDSMKLESKISLFHHRATLPYGAVVPYLKLQLV